MADQHTEILDGQMRVRLLPYGEGSSIRDPWSAFGISAEITVQRAVEAIFREQVRNRAAGIPVDHGVEMANPGARQFGLCLNHASRGSLVWTYDVYAILAEPGLKFAVEVLTGNSVTALLAAFGVASATKSVATVLLKVLAGASGQVQDPDLRARLADLELMLSETGARLEVAIRQQAYVITAETIRTALARRTAAPVFPYFEGSVLAEYVEKTSLGVYLILNGAELVATCKDGDFLGILDSVGSERFRGATVQCVLESTVGYAGRSIRGEPYVQQLPVVRNASGDAIARSPVPGNLGITSVKRYALFGSSEVVDIRRPTPGGGGPDDTTTPDAAESEKNTRGTN